MYLKFRNEHGDDDDNNNILEFIEFILNGTEHSSRLQPESRNKCVS